jgi:C4-dicarboxylate-specific signal transduction histidine kinase
MATFIAARDERHACGCAAAMSSGELRPSMAALVTADHAEREIEWRAKTLRDGDGRVSGLLCIGTDLTERLAAQRELRKLQGAVQERGRLADIGAITAKVVHDLGNPLAALSMQSQLILRRARRGDFQPVAPVQQPAEQIHHRRCAALLEAWCASSPTSPATNISPRPISSRRRFCGRSSISGRRWRPNAASRYGSSIAPGRRLRADEVMLRRVLDNLIKNAVDAIGAGPGEITIETEASRAGRISIAVGDSGRVPDGVDVFQTFETTKADGTGIGLAVATPDRRGARGRSGISHDPRGTTFASSCRSRAGTTYDTCRRLTTHA